MTESLGEKIANYDNKIKDILTKIINNKESTINEYKHLKQILPKYDKVRRENLEKILNTQRQQLEDRLTLKTRQNEALFTLLAYLNSLEKKEKNLHISKTLEQIKKKELKELQQINKRELKDTHGSLLHLAQLGNNNFSVFKQKIDILDKIYDCITHIDITEEQYMISNKNLIMQNTRIIKPENNIKNQQLSPIKIKYSIPNSPQSNNIISSSEPYQATLDKLGSSSRMMNKPGEKVKTCSSARLEETHRVFSNEQYLECFSNY